MDLMITICSHLNFIKMLNVSESDLDQRSDTIQQLVEQQQDLLTSLLEAPSQVYKQEGVPPDNLGKAGDYYVDMQNNVAYGPKPTNTDWGTSFKLTTYIFIIKKNTYGI